MDISPSISNSRVGNLSEFKFAIRIRGFWSLGRIATAMMKSAVMAMGSTSYRE
jgi:hypothetical protein